jgi:uncharacterized protein
MSPRSLLPIVLFALVAVARAQSGPSFACDPPPESTVEKLVCQEPALADLDRKLAAAYKEATAKASGTAASTLTATQRGWIKGRNECWKASSIPACVTQSYRTRIAELQAGFRLLEPVGSARYTCPGSPPIAVTADFFDTDPRSAFVTFGSETEVMFVMPSGSGARYSGGNSQLWEHQGTALIRWNLAKRELRCPKRSQ